MSNTLVHSSPGTRPSAKWEDQMSETGDNRVLRGKPDWTDLVFFLILVAGAAYDIVTYPNEVDIYEKYILVGSKFFFTWVGWQ